MGIWVRRRHRR